MNSYHHLNATMIAKLADQLETEYGVKVLFSRIVGSHMWGYADDVSDYDVQFVYVRPLNDYLSFLPRKQIRYETSFVTPGLAGHADVFAYDLQDFVRLMSKSDMNVSQFMFAQRIGEEALCWHGLNELFGRHFQPNLLTRKYLGHSRSSLAALNIKPDDRSNQWNVVRAMVCAHQLHATGKLAIPDILQASHKFTPDLKLTIDPERRPGFDKAAFRELLAATDAWDLSYPERTDEQVEEFNTMAKAIIRRFANPDWS